MWLPRNWGEEGSSLHRADIWEEGLKHSWENTSKSIPVSSMLPSSIIKTCVRSQKKVLLHLGGSNSEPYHWLIPKCHVQLWELDYKEGWALKNWCFQTVLLQKTPEYPLESKESKPVTLKETQPWILFGRTDAEAAASILWPPDANWKRPDAGKYWRLKEKRVTEDEMVG